MILGLHEVSYLLAKFLLSNKIPIILLSILDLLFEWNLK